MARRYTRTPPHKFGRVLIPCRVCGRKMSPTRKLGTCKACQNCTCVRCSLDGEYD